MKIVCATDLPLDFIGAADEFLVEATGGSTPTRQWTRARLAACIAIAKDAVESLGYQKAQVFNIFGGNKSDALYTVEM